MTKTIDQLDLEITLSRTELKDAFAEIMAQLADQRRIIDLLADHVKLPIEGRPPERMPPVGFT